MARRKRRDDVITVRLSVKSDGDLIEWWGLQPSLSGSAAVKAAVRAYIRTSAENSAAPAPLTADLVIDGVNHLDQLMRAMTAEITALRAQLASGFTVATPTAGVPDVDRLSAEKAATIAANIDSADW